MREDEMGVSRVGACDQPFARRLGLSRAADLLLGLFRRLISHF
jgi:hypothetical protein